MEGEAPEPSSPMPRTLGCLHPPTRALHTEPPFGDSFLGPGLRIQKGMLSHPAALWATPHHSTQTSGNSSFEPASPRHRAPQRVQSSTNLSPRCPQSPARRRLCQFSL